jgi:hypothetical protein
MSAARARPTNSGLSLDFDKLKLVGHQTDRLPSWPYILKQILPSAFSLLKAKQAEG